MEPSQGPLSEEMFHSFLQLAVKRQASDVHFEVGYPPTYRVFGELLAAKYPPLTHSDTEAIAHFLLAAARSGFPPADYREVLMLRHLEGLTFPEIYSMQIRAILEAAALCANEGLEIYPEIMVPQVATVEELKRIRVEREPVAAALTPDGRYLVVANHLHAESANRLHIGAAVSIVCRTMVVEGNPRQAELP